MPRWLIPTLLLTLTTTAFAQQGEREPRAPRRDGPPNIERPADGERRMRIDRRVERETRIERGARGAERGNPRGGRPGNRQRPQNGERAGVPPIVRERMTMLRERLQVLRKRMAELRRHVERRAEDAQPGERRIQQRRPMPPRGRSS